MLRTVYYGYNANGEFHIRLYERSAEHAESDNEQLVALTRSECQKIAKHMQFGKKGEERVVESVDGKELK